MNVVVFVVFVVGIREKMDVLIFVKIEFFSRKLLFWVIKNWS